MYEHMLRASIGILGGSKTVTGRKDAKYMPAFANASAPKNAAMNLFLRVSAYILRRSHFSRSWDKQTQIYLNMMKMSEDIKKKQVKVAPARYAARHLGVGTASAQNYDLSST